MTMMKLRVAAFLAGMALLSSPSPAATAAAASASPSSLGTRLAFFWGDKAKHKSPLKRSQRELARTTLSGLEKEARLILFSEDDGCGGCGKAKNLLEEIAAMSPLLSFETLALSGNERYGAELGIDKVPGIAIVDGAGNSPGIRYFGIPLGYEYEAFLEAVVNTAHGSPGLKPETMEGLGLVKKPVTITIFVTQH